VSSIIKDEVAAATYGFTLILSMNGPKMSPPPMPSVPAATPVKKAAIATPPARLVVQITS
jgi:hypothetical protein